MGTPWRNLAPHLNRTRAYHTRNIEGIFDVESRYQGDGLLSDLVWYG